MENADASSALACVTYWIFSGRCGPECFRDKEVMSSFLEGGNGWTRNDRRCRTIAAAILSTLPAVILCLAAIA